MGLSIHTNYASLVTQNQLNSTNKSLSTAMQRLGTGLRINSAADDAAGLQIATRLQAQSNGQKVGMSNSQDAISMLQTAEGAMEEMTNIVQRMKDLATQAANGTNSTTDISAMDSEYKSLQDELKNITDNTTFAGKSLLDNTSGKFQSTVTFQIGGKSTETMDVDVATALGTVTASTSVAGVAGTLSSGTANGLIDTLDTLLNNIGTVRSAFGANINRLDHTINNLSNMKENTDTAKGRIMDADYAAESSSMTKNQMLLQSGISVLSNSNQMTSLVTSLLR
jgi:Flagellin and related hook-associated proteins